MCYRCSCVLITGVRIDEICVLLFMCCQLYLFNCCLIYMCLLQRFTTKWSYIHPLCFCLCRFVVVNLKVENFSKLFAAKNILLLFCFCVFLNDRFKSSHVWLKVQHLIIYSEVAFFSAP